MASPGRPPRFEGDELDTLISHYQDGWTTTELAEEFNTSTGTISTTLSRAGITARPRGRPRLFSDPQRLNALVEAYEDGTGVIQLALDYDCAPSVVRTALVDAGITLRSVSQRGEASSQAVLNEALVRDLRRRYEAGESYNVLARETGLSNEAIRKAVTGKTWSHVPGAVKSRRSGAQKKVVS